MSTEKHRQEDLIVSEFGIRLAETVGKFRFQKQFCAKTGVSENSLSKVLNGLQPLLSSAEITQICLNLKVNANWLLTGEGEMLNKDQVERGSQESYNQGIQKIQKLEQEVDAVKDELIELLRENRVLFKDNANLKSRNAELEATILEKPESQGRQKKAN